MISRIVFPFVSGLAIVCSCYSVDIAGQSSFNNCPNSAVIAAGTGISDFKQRIPKQTAVAPPDSILDVTLTFATAVTQTDRDRITAAGGMNVSTAGTAASLKAQFSAQDLTSYIANDNGRLTDAVIYIPACASD